jgi:hypothetical protein
MLTHDMKAEAIALAIWETSTNNGRKLDRDDWDSHMQNCHAAVANSYHENLTEAEWHAAALARITA